MNSEALSEIHFVFSKPRRLTLLSHQTESFLKKRYSLRAIVCQETTVWQLRAMDHAELETQKRTIDLRNLGNPNAEAFKPVLSFLYPSILPVPVSMTIPK